MKCIHLLCIILWQLMLKEKHELSQIKLQIIQKLLHLIWKDVCFFIYLHTNHS